MTNITFILETSPNAKPKEKKVGGHGILCPPRLKSPPCPPPNCAHEMFISYHKIALVSCHQSVCTWLIFYGFCSKNILTKLVAYHQPTCRCVSVGNSWLATFRFHVNCIDFHGAVFVHVGPAQLCREMVFCFTCAMLWKYHG